MNNTLPKWRHFFILAPLVFYFLTAARAPGWLDASLLTYYAGQLRLGSWVNNHNLFTVIGHALMRTFGRVDPHYVLVLACATFGAITVHLTFLIGLEIGKPVSAMIGAAALMLSHSLWWHSTMVEVYTLNSALIAGIILMILRFRRTGQARHVYAAFLLWGLGCSNHVLMGLFLPAFVAYAVMLGVQRRVGGWRPYVVMIACFVAGASLLIAMVVRDIAGAYRALSSGVNGGASPFIQAVLSTLDRATGGHFKSHMFTEELTRHERLFWRANYPFLVFVNYPSVALPAGILGFAVIWMRDSWKSFFVFVVLAIAAQAVWSANYFIWDMYAFALPVYLLFIVPVIYGIDWLIERHRVSRIIVYALLPTLLLPLVLYPSAERWYENGRFMTRYFNNYRELHWTPPLWNPVGYIANPNKRNYDLTERIADSLFDGLPENSAILTNEAGLDYPMRLYYQATLGTRTDIRYISYFAMFLTSERVESVAARLNRSIQRSTPTYVSTIGPPDRLILNALWLLRDPEADANAVAALDTVSFMANFPDLTFEPVELTPDEHTRIYRLTPRLAELRPCML